MKVEIVERVSKKTNKPYRCLELTIGDYSTLIFCSKFELMYIEKYFDEQGKK